MGFRDEAEQRLHGRHALEREGFHQAVELHAVAAVAEQGGQAAPHGWRQGALAGGHPAAVPQQGVDLTVVANAVEGLGQGPIRQRVGGVALVVHGHGRLEIALRQVGGVEVAQRRGHHKALVHHRMGGEGHHGEVQPVARGPALDAPPGAVEQELKLCHVDTLGPCDEHLRDARHGLACAR